MLLPARDSFSTSCTGALLSIPVSLAGLVIISVTVLTDCRVEGKS